MSESKEDGKQDRSKYGKKNTRGPWAHLDEETRIRYEEIEQRVRDKVERGEL